MLCWLWAGLQLGDGWCPAAGISWCVCVFLTLRHAEDSQEGQHLGWNGRFITLQSKNTGPESKTDQGSVPFQKPERFCGDFLFKRRITWESTERRKQQWCSFFYRKLLWRKIKFYCEAKVTFVLSFWCDLLKLIGDSREFATNWSTLHWTFNIVSCNIRPVL